MTVTTTQYTALKEYIQGEFSDFQCDPDAIDRGYIEFEFHISDDLIFFAKVYIDTRIENGESTVIGSEIDQDYGFGAMDEDDNCHFTTNQKNNIISTLQF